MNFCKYGAYRVKQGLGYSKRVICWDQLIAKYSIQQIKEFLKTKAVVINYCGKCDYCLSVKKNQYKKRVKSQLLKSKYNYLITLTFDNDKIDTLITDNQRAIILNNDVSLSPLSNLSKNTISNIIKNWKNKLNKHYNNDITFHYFLCGEYGENTKRAHYHILLMLNKPIPDLKKQNVKGSHFKSSLIDSKQYSLYDIEPANYSTNTAGYISKYLTKSNEYDKSNFNNFQDEQINWYIKNNIEPFGLPLLNKDTDLKYLFLFNLLQGDLLYLYLKNFNWNIIKVRECKQQRPFVKISRGLGMDKDPLVNYKSGVINTYYFNKYVDQKEKDNYKGIDTPELDKVIDLYKKQRLKNIQEYFYKSKRSPKDKDNLKDIF